MKRGMQSVPNVKYSEAIVDAVCERIASGDSLREICDEAGMPSKASFYFWLDDPTKTGLLDKYARARQRQADHWAQAILDVAHDARLKDPNELAHARVKIDAYKWTASKLKPKSYGDRVISDVTATVDVTGTVSPAESLKDYLDAIAKRRGATD